MFRCQVKDDFVCTSPGEFIAWAFKNRNSLQQDMATGVDVEMKIMNQLANALGNRQDVPDAYRKAVQAFAEIFTDMRYIFKHNFKQQNFRI